MAKDENELGQQWVVPKSKIFGSTKETGQAMAWHGCHGEGGTL